MSIRKQTQLTRGLACALLLLCGLFTGCTKDVSGSGRPLSSGADTQTTSADSGGTTAPASATYTYTSGTTTTVIVGHTTLPAAFTSGNSNGNLANGGIAAFGDGTRFYVNNNTVYKQKTASRSAAVLTYLDGVCQLNYCGGMLYCTAKDGIYCIHVESGQAKRVVDLDIQAGSWISLQMTADGVFYSDGKTIWRNTIAFDQEQVLLEAATATVDQLLWTNGTLYYTMYTASAQTTDPDSSAGLYAIDLSKTGTDATRTIHAGVCHSVALVQQTLYYVDPAQHAVMRTALDGSGTATAFAGDYEGLLPLETGFLALRAGNIVRLGTDGGGETVLATGYCPCYVEQTLYYWGETNTRLEEQPLS